MELKEIIDLVSKLYKEECKHVKVVYDEYVDVTKKLLNANHDGGEHITHAEYTYLQERKEALKREIDMQKSFCDGIACAREELFRAMERKENENEQIS